MRVLATESVHTRPSAWPDIDMSGNFSGHVSAKSPSNISHRSHIKGFGTLGQLWKYPPFPPKTHIVQGEGGSPIFVRVWNLPKNCIVRVDTENDPDTVDKMLEDAIKIEIPEDDPDRSTKVSQKGTWINDDTV